MDDLPTDFDAIVVGTGMTESIIAAAFSRIGQSVLHLDSNEYYGENWASFNLESFEKWINAMNQTKKKKIIQNEDLNNLLEENEKVLNISFKTNVWNVKHNGYVRKEKTVEKVQCNPQKGGEITEEANKENMKPLEESVDENMKRLSRKFNLDLCPKLLFSKGTLVELLINSNIAGYAEFKSVSRVLTWRDNKLEPVPCSRADVFATKNVSVVQKRILVKILTLFANYTENFNEFQGFENKKFLDYLKHKKLPDNLIHYILYAIAMGDNKTPCMNGVKACKTFLESLGRYGNTPFIFSLYGSGELPQCFCRLCAVFGGIYCLQRGIESLIVKDNKCVGIVSNGKRLNAKRVILSSSNIPEGYLENENSENISRGVFITNRSILKGEKESLTLLQFPPVPRVAENSVTVLELSPGTCTCPDNFFVVHMTAESSRDAESDLKHVVESLFEAEKEEVNAEGISKPKVLWSATWNVAKGSSCVNEKCPENVRICRNVDSDLDYDFSVKEARRIFSELCPSEEFLPRAPDPNEIVLDDENDSNKECKEENKKEKSEEEANQENEINNKSSKESEEDNKKSEGSEGDANLENESNNKDSKEDSKEKSKREVKPGDSTACGTRNSIIGGKNQQSGDS